MAQRQRRISARDQVYLQSTGFEVYMGAGAVFVLVLTAFFVYSIKIHFEWLIWPGMFVAVVAGYITLKWLERRELARKLAEIEADPKPDVTTT
jgi:cobalamin biosynthesis protein CobD/CbiB